MRHYLAALLMVISVNVSVTATHATPATLPNNPAKEISSDAWNEAHSMTVQADVTGYATVAESGAYADITGKPVLAAVATGGSYANLTGTPVLAAVATAGSYASLTGQPSIPSAVFKTISISGQSTITAANLSDNFEIVQGTNVTVLATTSGNRITISAAAGGGITLEDVYPVGSIYTSTNSVSPTTIFGFGTWAALPGKFLVGYSTGNADFGTAAQTGGATGTSYTPSGTLDLGLYIAKGTVSFPASVPTFLGGVATATSSVSWPTGVPTNATATVSSSVNWPAGVPTFAGTSHRHELPIIHTTNLTVRFLPTATFGVGTSRVPDVRTTVTASGAGPGWFADVTNSGAVMMSQSATAAGVITWPASVPQAVDSSGHTHIITWPATAPAAVVSVTPTGTISWPSGQPTFTGATGSGSGIFTGVAKTVAVLPPYLTVFMWERTA